MLRLRRNNVEAIRTRLIILGAAAALALAGCTGGTGQQAGAGLQTGQAGGVLHSYHVTSSGLTADLEIRANKALPDSSIRFHDLNAPKNAHEAKRSASSCPSPPPIDIYNPFPFPITIQLESFTVRLPCSSSGLFGATFVQIKPVPALISPVKLGDAKASGYSLTFTPAVTSFTLAPKTTYQILIAAEQSTSDVAFPVVPSATTNLTANAPDIASLPTFNGLNISYPNASGASSYSAACFPAFTNGQLAPFLQTVPLVGHPAFYCQLTTPNNAPLTLGQTVNFTVLSPPADRAVFQPDGTTQGFACTAPANNASSCNVPQFTIPTTYQNFIVGNVQDLRICVPARPSVDCNGFANDPQGGTRSSVPCCREFQLLVADDPTYAPPASSLQPWDGLFRMVYTPGVCQASRRAIDNGNAPPGYSDDEQKGVGPAAEFDVRPLAAGTCTVTVSEDPKFILDDTNPNAPVPRSATVSVTITNDAL